MLHSRSDICYENYHQVRQTMLPISSKLLRWSGSVVSYLSFNHVNELAAPSAILIWASSTVLGINSAQWVMDRQLVALTLNNYKDS